MTLLLKLKEEGWHLTDDGLKKLTSDLQTEDVKKVIASALNWDIKDIGGGALPAKPESNGSITGRIVLQMQKMRNISAPKANEESTTSPRFLQLELSDGVSSVNALELERIPNLNLNVAPGTKFYFKSEKLQMMQGFLVLKAAEVQILGGRVENLAEKWESARQLLKYAKSNRRLSGAGAPPPWIAFEKRMDVHKDALALDRNFKSLQAASDKDKNSKENDEFNAARTQAIAEAAKAGKRKVFGGGQQNMLDHNVKKIIEKGYTEDDATYALRTTNNNLERALFSLKKRNNKAGVSATTAVAADTRGGPRGRGAATAKEEATASKPQANVSLFEFLTAKIPMATSSSATSTSAQPQAAVSSAQTSKPGRETRNPFRTNDTSSNNANNKDIKDSKGFGKFENNMSSSFAANRVSYTPRSDDRLDKHSQSSNHTQSQRPNYNQREERSRTNPTNKPNNRGGDRSRTSNEKSVNNQTAGANANGVPPQIGNSTSINNSNNNNSNNSVQSSSSTYNSNSIRRNDRNDKAPRKDREQTSRQNIGSGTGGYQGNKRNQEFKPNDNKAYQQRDNNSRGNSDNKSSNNSNSFLQTPSQSKSNNSFENTMEILTESTSKMSLQNKKEPYNSSQGRGRHQGGPSRNSNQTSSHAKSNNSQQQTSQFISSQNFTNKSQAASKPIASGNIPSSQQQQPSHTFVAQLPNGYSYDPSKIIGFQSKEANEYAMNLLKNQGIMPQQATGPPAPQASMPPPQLMNNSQPAPPTAVAYLPQNPNVFMATPQAPMAQYGMMPGGSWPWNIGDLCLAKYWEDESYYKAKITAVSENTCVVLFMGYGNYEEVLKAHCLPITEASHHPLNAFQSGPPPPPPPGQMLAHSYQGPNVAAGGGGGANQRYRTERQMYVPPPKRANPNNN